MNDEAPQIMILSLRFFLSLTKATKVNWNQLRDTLSSAHEQIESEMRSRLRKKKRKRMDGAGEITSTHSGKKIDKREEENLVMG